MCVRAGQQKHLRHQACTVLTPGRRQSKKLSTIDEGESKIDRNSVFNCHLSPVWRQIAIENTVSIYFLSTFLDSIGIFDCRLPGVVLVLLYTIEIAKWFQITIHCPLIVLKKA